MRSSHKILRKGSRGKAVGQLQAKLLDFGFLAKDKSRKHPRYDDLVAGPILPSDEHDRFGDATRQALLLYQERARIPQTGEFDSTTKAAMRRPRCDLPAYVRALVLGRKVPGKTDKRGIGPNIGYQFENISAKLLPSEVRRCIEMAMGMWQAVTPIRWLEVASGSYTSFAFATKAHGDKGHRILNSFDGPSGTLAHAMRGGKYDGDVHFDDDEAWWGPLQPVPFGKIDLVTVAAHEIGHTLGLGHSSIPGALMYEEYLGTQRTLHQDDVSRIQALYGMRDRDLRVRLESGAFVPVTTDTRVFLSGGISGRPVGQPSPFVCADYGPAPVRLYKDWGSINDNVVRDGDNVSVRAFETHWWYVSTPYVIADRHDFQRRPYIVVKTTPPDPAVPETLDPIIRHNDLIRLKNLSIWEKAHGDEWVELPGTHGAPLMAYHAFAKSSNETETRRPKGESRRMAKPVR